MKDKAAKLFTYLIVSDATTNKLLQMLTDSIQKEKTQCKLSLRAKIHKLWYRESKNLQIDSTEVEKIVVDLTRFNDMVTDKHEIGTLLRSFPKRFGFVALMIDTFNEDYDSVCALFNFEMELQMAHSNLFASFSPAARNAFAGKHFTKNEKRQIQYRDRVKFCNSKLEVRKRRRNEQFGRMKRIRKTLFNTAGRLGQFF